MRSLRLLLAAAVVAGLGAAPGALAQEPPAPGATLYEVCTESGVPGIPELGPRTCKSFDSGAVLIAQLCSNLPAPPGACAAATDGRVIDPAAVDAFEQSWVWRALRLQDQLDDGEQLRNVLLPHTHNSYNSTAYDPTLSDIDPNQRYSLTDQLRMGIRGIELDLHWAPNPSGTAEDGGNAVVLCHGEAVPVGAVTIHAGCTVDRPFTAGLEELQAFLDAPGNEDEFLLLYLENALDDDPVAHDRAAATVEEVLGDLVERPPADQPCAPMPLDRSQAELRAAGHRVLIVGNCGPGDGWGSWVFERGPEWDEGGGGGGYPAYPDCIEAERVPRAYDDNWIRVYEDSTWLSAMASGSYNPVDADETRSMVRCGVDMVGFDRVEPGDGRLQALVWSWAPDEPVADPAKQCVAWGIDARFRVAGCGEIRGFACRTLAGDWVVPPDRGPASAGPDACGAIGAAVDTPPTGWQNEQLRKAAAAASAGELWLDIAAPVLPVPGGGAAPAGPASDQAADSGRGLPATGADVRLTLAALLLVAGLVSRGWGGRPTPSRPPSPRRRRWPG